MGFRTVIPGTSVAVEVRLDQSHVNGPKSSPAGFFPPT
jgi:hypothetical protein